MRKVQLVYQDKTYQEAHTQTYGNRDLRLMMKIYVHRISDLWHETGYASMAGGMIRRISKDGYPRFMKTYL